MKEFARITLSLPEISQRLESLLSKEIAIVPNGASYVVDNFKQAPKDYLPHHNVLAQPRFQFLPLVRKQQEL